MMPDEIGKSKLEAAKEVSEKPAWWSLKFGYDIDWSSRYFMLKCLNFQLFYHSALNKP